LSSFFDKNTSHLQSKIILEVGAMANGFILPVFVVLARTLMILVIFILLFMVNPLLTSTVALILFAAFYLAYHFKNTLLKDLGQKKLDANFARFRNLNEIFSGLKTWRMYGVEHFF